MYGAEFAEIYDLVYMGRGKDYQHEAAYMAELIRSRSPEAASLLDVGCGTAAHLVHFADLFDRVAGLEYAEAMVAMARAKFDDDGVHRVHQGDMRDFDLGTTFDAITCMFGTLGHALTEEELSATLRRFEAHLAPGGVVVVDPWWFSENFVDGHVSGDVCTRGSRTVARVSHTAREGERSRMSVHYVVADTGTGVRHFDETYVTRLFTRQMYEEAFRRAGFRTDYIPGVQSGRGVFIAVRDR
jgi:SAM-dependent methyltransferase